jgi:hypothetical protein
MPKKRKKVKKSSKKKKPVRKKAARKPVRKKSHKGSIKKKPVAKKKQKRVRAAKAKKKPVKRAKPKKKTAKPKVHHHVEDVLYEELEKQGKDIFYPEKHWTLWHWLKKYSPVIITLLIGLGTYFFLVFYLFYPTTILQGQYIQLLILLTFIFLMAGMLIYLGLHAELIYVRILSFIFVFVIFTFLLLFILLAHAMQSGLSAV